MHNDQHGAAVVILGALLNALKVVKRAIQDITVVAIGPGAAGIVCCEWLLGAGITRLRGVRQTRLGLTPTNHRTATSPP